jgi:hypothetical protein
MHRELSMEARKEFKRIIVDDAWTHGHPEERSVEGDTDRVTRRCIIIYNQGT